MSRSGFQRRLQSAVCMARRGCQWAAENLQRAWMELGRLFEQRTKQSRRVELYIWQLLVCDRKRPTWGRQPTPMMASETLDPDAYQAVQFFIGTYLDAGCCEPTILKCQPIL